MKSGKKPGELSRKLSGSSGGLDQEGGKRKEKKRKRRPKRCAMSGIVYRPSLFIVGGFQGPNCGHCT